MQETFKITGKTKLYGIIGHPIGHSLSPVMQNAALKAAGIDGVYLPFHVLPEQLPQAVEGLKALQVSGFNVTIPHKTVIMPLLDKLAPSACQAGAVNTVVNHNGCLIGHNTDGDGLVASLRTDLNFDPMGKNIVMIGAGGAARGALAALCRHGAATVNILNRTRETAVKLVNDLQPLFGSAKLQAAALTDDNSMVLSTADLLINSSSAGMNGECIDGIDLELLSNNTCVYDMVYNPMLTPLINAVRIRRLQVVNGLGMLIAQGELAFKHWHGVEVPYGVMRESLTPF
jgi:shikimate dehydrogenase